MYVRHEEIPALSSWPTTVPAARFNRVRRALARAGGAELRVDLPGLRSLDLILQPGAWVVADHAINDMPVAAWTGFAPDPDRVSDTPVACALTYFHGYAALVTGRAMALADRWLACHLDDGGAGRGDIVPFPGPRNG